ncbi:MAG: hypothetical protein ACPGJF_10550 [Sinimarinibacterium flocculans]|uniref:hypothetical protein n=1 Tax=Sinimarinibacterium flocculans TaxID=985250 RepID=UPI003C4472B2
MTTSDEPAGGVAVRVEATVGPTDHCANCGWPPQCCDCYDYDDGYDCPHCDEGTLLVCFDDMFRGQGWCMHGDGEVMCPHCNGSGVLQPNAGLSGGAAEGGHVRLKP